MPKLRIVLETEVPAGLFEQAAAIAKIKPHIDKCWADMSETMDDTVTLDHELIEAPRVRKLRADKGTARTRPLSREAFGKAQQEADALLREAMAKHVPAAPAQRAAE